MAVLGAKKFNAAAAAAAVACLSHKVIAILAVKAFRLCDGHSDNLTHISFEMIWLFIPGSRWSSCRFMIPELPRLVQSLPKYTYRIQYR